MDLKERDCMPGEAYLRVHLSVSLVVPEKDTSEIKSTNSVITASRYFLRNGKKFISISKNQVDDTCSIDIPDHFVSVTNYSATLGHKVS